MLRRDETFDVISFARWFRILIEISQQMSDLAVIQSMFSQVSHVVSISKDTYPQDEIAWLTASAWNTCLGARGSGDEEGVRMWAHVALELTNYDTTGSAVAGMIREAYPALIAEIDGDGMDRLVL
jgi:hypothetical protein